MMALNQILPSALVIAVAIIGVSVTAMILGKMKDTQVVGSEEYNITNKGLTALGQFGDWWGIIIIVVIAVIVISLVLGIAYVRQMQ